MGICLCLVGLPLQAAESSDEIVAMLQWWEEYGRFLEEVDMTSSLEGEELFVQLGSEYAYFTFDGD